MTLVALFLKAMKLAGALATLTFAANAFSFSRFRNKNLRPFRSPIDESSDTFAAFDVTTEGENGFFFGLATAPAHAEDRLDDAWIKFAEEKIGDDDSQEQEIKQPVDALLGSAAGDGGSHQATSPPSRYPGEQVKKGKKPLKVVMEVMVRGFEKYMEVEGEEQEQQQPHNKVTA